MTRRHMRQETHEGTLSLGVLLASLALVGLCWVWALTGAPVQDYTDSGVGCVDDCLEIQDEAQTDESMARN